MDRDKKITPITRKDIQDIINNSVMGEANRLVGNATEQKKMFVRPIANTDNTPNVMTLLQRIADEAEQAIEEVAEKSASASTEGLQPSVDQALETASKTIVGAINELRRQLAKATVLELTEVVSELPEVGDPNKFYLLAKETTDASDLYDEWIWVNKGTKDSPDYKWEYAGAKKIEFNADEYVKKTDYATESKAGVITSSDYYGYGVAGGALYAYILSFPDYDAKTYFSFISKGTLEKIKYRYVKSGLVDSTETWTDEEKASARALIGAVGEEELGDINTALEAILGV